MDCKIIMAMNVSENNVFPSVSLSVYVRFRVSQFWLGFAIVYACKMSSRRDLKRVYSSVIRLLLAVSCWIYVKHRLRTRQNNRSI